MTRTLPASLILLLATCRPADAATNVFLDEASFLAAAGTPTLIDFDLLSDAEDLVAQFAVDGVSFAGFSGGLAEVLTLSVPPFCVDNHSEPLSFDTVAAFQGGGGFQMSFSPPLEAVGLWIGDLETLPGATTLNLLDASGQNIGSFDLPAQLGNSACLWKFFGVTSDQHIYQVTLSISSLDYVLFDDLYFRTSRTALLSVSVYTGDMGCPTQSCITPTHAFDSAAGSGRGLLELSGGTLDFRVGGGTALFKSLGTDPDFEFSDVVYSGTATVDSVGSTHTITSGTALISGTGGDAICPNPFTTSALDVSGSCEGAGSDLSCVLTFTLTDPAFDVGGQPRYFVHTVAAGAASVPALGPAGLVALVLALFLTAVMRGRRFLSR